MASSAPVLTLTSLLNSLHTHLQTQTQILPTLHGQLGLPPSALEDELEALQKQLFSGVEDRVNNRRREVQEWIEKCEVCEKACQRYSKALGGNAKAIGIPDLRREKVLPKRYEMTIECQEKLRQLYHSKLEQLMNLTNRINSLSRSLDVGFFCQEILEPVVAIGEDLADPTANRDVTPERFSKLEKELVRGKTEVARRLSQLSATFVQIDWLHTELGLSPPFVDDFSPTNSVFCSSDPFLVSTPTPSSRTSPTAPLLYTDDADTEGKFLRIFANFVARIEETDTGTLSDNVILENVEPSPPLLAWAAAQQAALEDTKRRREAHIQAMYDQLEALWRRLGVGEADMDEFVEAHRGSTEETVKAYEEELERMIDLKRERMSVFIASAREEIGKLWDELMVGEEERADFAPMVDDEHTEELLIIHEDEIRRLKEERRLKAPLLASIRKYFDICEEEKELAAAASDQSRLLGRSARDPGRLLREEKMRKRVQKEKPRLEQDLLASVPAWENETGRPFLVHGESILHILMDIMATADQENKRKPTRGGFSRATTPIHSRANNSMTPRVRPGSSLASHSVPNKRQRLADERSQVNYSVGRPPLGVHGGGNGTRSNHFRTGSGGLPTTTSRSSSPNKMLKSCSSLPRPVSKPVITMVAPKAGTQAHALGHGRLPTVMVTHGQIVPYGGMNSSNPLSRSTPSASTYGVSFGHSEPGATKKAMRARRESFKPRPSHDSVAMNTSNRWVVEGEPLDEVDERY